MASLQSFKDSLAKVRQRLAAVGAATARFYRANTLLVLSAYTIVSILLIFWARIGFTLDVSRFFAAQVGQLSVQCGTTQNVLTWTFDDRANSNRIERGNIGVKNLPSCADYWCWLPSTTYVHQVPTAGTQATYVDNQLQSGTCYEYRVKYQPSLASNSVYCPQNCNIPATPTPTPTPSLTPTPTPSLIITPTPTLSLTPTPTASLTPTPTSSLTPTPSLAPTPTPTSSLTPTPVGVLGISMTGKNFSTSGVESGSVQVRTGQQVQVILRVRNDSTVANLNGVMVLASLPAGLAYLQGTTVVSTVAGVTDTLTTTGLALGTLGPRQEVRIDFRATAMASQFDVGTTQVQVVGQVQAAAVPGDSSSVNVIVTKPGASTVGAVQTGPGDALLVAFLISSILTLLYVSYTHTSTYRRHEIGSIAEERDPLDFRS